ncbi:DUF1176 domain-containing protein [Brucella gallinifaecis]|uniref:DUF1176 domain-containing protein n=1 Tax=Brucella gallinifaecis TaxID=215590 RepID=A0A502BTT2_9HYPH|nr:DUF1176 domain-containing protein [Brucella gallinifaecis]TPF76568.1 DUF1176 domain-containing protein [Brucella gallinifaecis]
MFSRLYNHKARFALASIVAILGGIGSASAAFKEIRDSWVLCDYASNCTLTLKSNNQSAPTFSLYRSSDAGALPHLRFSGFDPKPVSGKLSISVDGKPVVSADLSALKMHNDQFDYANASDVAKLIDAMKSGQKLTLQLNNKTYEYSLSGFVGGLIYVDEQQARNGTVAALQAKGKKPAPSAPDVSLITKIDQLPAQIRPDFSDENGVCGTNSGNSFATGGGFNAKIADGLNLIAMPCGSPGAYNQSYVFYSQSDDKVVPIPLPTISDDGPSTVDEAWNIDWTQSTKMLTAFFKARGLGDCGSYDVWKATDDGEGKVRFVLIEERSKGDCDGNYAGGPEKWPASWPVSAK